MRDYRVDKETAELEFERFVDCMDLDVDTSFMDQEDRTAFEKQKRLVVESVRRGSLIFNEDGEAVYTPQNDKTRHKDPLTFHESTGASLMAMDGKKRNHDVGKTFAVMADMCNVHPSALAGLVGIDRKVCMALFALLMD